MNTITIGEIEYAVTLFGIFFSGVFSLFLAGMITKARRDSRTDQSLAVVMFFWSLVCWTAVYRNITGETTYPHLRIAVWIGTMIAIMFASWSIVREQRALISEQVRLKNLTERQESLADRQEQLTDRLEHLSHGDGLTHDATNQGQERREPR